MKVYGLTGGPGCGKSAVSAYLNQKAKWRIYDADAVCHELYRDPASSLTRGAVALWGKKILSADGCVDRKILASVVFGKQDELAKLNALAHPAIRDEIMSRIQKDAVCCEFGILDAALLFETNWQHGLAGTIAVWTDEATQMKRLRDRGWSEEVCRARIAAQISSDDKLARADYGIINTGSLAFLYEQCDSLIQTIVYNGK